MALPEAVISQCHQHSEAARPRTRAARSAPQPLGSRDRYASFPHGCAWTFRGIRAACGSIPDSTSGRVLVVGAAAYVTLVVTLRLSGKRTLAKLNAFDFVVTIAIGSTLATILLNTTVS